jgi:hypothetical protein
VLTRIIILAAADPLGPAVLPEGHAPNLFGLGLREILLIVGVAIALGLVLFLWVFLTHKRRRLHSSDHLSKAIYRAEKMTPEESAKRMKMRKRRRRHPDNLPRNPTLGETGGLPPLRPDEPPPEAAPQP